MADKFTDKELYDYWKAFSVFDENGDGTISTDELGRVLKSLGEELSPDEVQAMIREVDADDNGTVDFDEFLSLIVPSQPEGNTAHNDLLRAFEAFDVNGDGFITKDELREGLQILGEDVTEEELTELIKIIDHDDDGQIRYTEFVNLMASSS